MVNELISSKTVLLNGTQAGSLPAVPALILSDL